MEERIIEYEENYQIEEIISDLTSEDFLLVEHKTQTKQLFFKKINCLPQSELTEEF